MKLYFLCNPNLLNSVHNKNIFVFMVNKKDKIKIVMLPANSKWDNRNMFSLMK